MKDDRTQLSLDLEEIGTDPGFESVEGFHPALLKLRHLKYGVAPLARNSSGGNDRPRFARVISGIANLFGPLLPPLSRG
jgi:hypothetical protein